MRLLKRSIPAADSQAICNIQSTNNAGDLIINGNLKNTDNNAVSFIKDGYSNQVAISSTSNLSTATFTISGTLDGIAISITISGPNNNTVVTSSFFDVVSSVSVNQAVSNVSVGTGGLTGVFFYPKGKNITLVISNNLFNSQTGSTLNFTSFTSMEDKMSLNNFDRSGSTYIRPNSVIQGTVYTNTSQVVLPIGFNRNNFANSILLCFISPAACTVTAYIEE